MIFDASDLNDAALESANDAANVFVESLLDVFCDEFLAELRAEHDVIGEFGIRAQGSRSLVVSDLVREIKSNASKWLNETQRNRWAAKFQWQKGFAAFTVSYSQIESVRKYIRNQQEHHATCRFRMSLLRFCASTRLISR